MARRHPVVAENELRLLVMSDSALICFRIPKLGASRVAMHRFIDGEDRMQQTLLPNSLKDYVSQETGHSG
jgi:hypothetical protein